jgi:hypothetical protein
MSLPVRRIVIRVLHVGNVPRIICSHLLGHHHDKRHRMIAGFCVMVVGVGCAKLAVFTSYELAKYLLDLFGYAIHGLGLTPFIESLLEEKDSP